MAQPAPPYCRRARSGLGTLARLAKTRRALCRQYDFARGGGISTAARVATYGSYKTCMTYSEKPAALGYRMPAEWEPHAATWLSWPRREGISFPGAFDRVLPALRAMVEALIGNRQSGSDSEKVCIDVSNGAHEAEAREVLQGLSMERMTF